MSITLSSRIRSALTNRRFTAATFPLGTYATNGVAVTAGDFGLSRIESMIVTAPGYQCSYVATDDRSGKVKVSRIPALDGNAASAQALAEVGNGVDLSSVTATAHIIGR